MHAVWDQHIPALHCPNFLACLTRMSQTTTIAFELQNELVSAMNSCDCICVQNTILSFPNISTATSHARNHEKTISFPNSVFALGGSYLASNRITFGYPDWPVSVFSCSVYHACVRLVLGKAIWCLLRSLKNLIAFHDENVVAV